MAKSVLSICKKKSIKTYPRKYNVLKYKADCNIEAIFVLEAICYLQTFWFLRKYRFGGCFGFLGQFI